MDEVTALKWTNTIFAADNAVDVGADKLLFVDNLNAQVSQCLLTHGNDVTIPISVQTKQSFINAMQLHNTTVHYLPAGCTDMLQPIDAGIGRLVKLRMNEELDTWLADPQNFVEWVSGMSASRRRVLITQWLGAAWEHVQALDLESMIARTGCCMTIDGQFDENIAPEGLTDYSFVDADADWDEDGNAVPAADDRSETGSEIVPLVDEESDPEISAGELEDFESSDSDAESENPPEIPAAAIPVNYRTQLEHPMDLTYLIGRHVLFRFVDHPDFSPLRWYFGKIARKTTAQRKIAHNLNFVLKFSGREPNGLRGDVAVQLDLAWYLWNWVLLHHDDNA